MSINTHKKVECLLQMIHATREEELTCSDCLPKLSEYVEAMLQNLPLDEALKKVEGHLAVCGDCREEYEKIKVAIDAIGRF